MFFPLHLVELQRQSYTPQFYQLSSVQSEKCCIQMANFPTDIRHLHWPTLFLYTVQSFCAFCMLLHSIATPLNNLVNTVSLIHLVLSEQGKRRDFVKMLLAD